MLRFWFLLVLLVSPLCAEELLDIQSDRNPQFLPYRIDVISYGTGSECSKRIFSPIHVFSSASRTNDTAFMVYAYNPPMNEDATGSLLLKAHRGKTVRENPTFMTIRDMALYYDNELNQNAAVSACYQNDSAFLEKIIFYPPGRDTLFLASGVDLTGNGEWEPEIRHINTVDYDYDGITELFFHVNPVRDKEPRLLFCIDPVNFRAEWLLPVASHIASGYLISKNDSLNPAVVVGTYAVSQGVTDENFNDDHGYLTMIDSGGRIINHKLTATTFNPTHILNSDTDSLFYVGHCLDYLDPETADTALHENYKISLLDWNFNVLASTDIEKPVSSIWLFDYDGKGKNDLYARLHDESVRIFDSELRLLARSEESGLGGYIGSMKIPQHKNPVMVFSESGLVFYTADFQKIAQIELNSGFGYIEPIVWGDDSTVTEFAAGAGNTFLVAGIKKREFGELFNIYVAEYKYYLLAIAFGLFCMLVAMVIFRAGMKKNLRLITNQKTEIEQTHNRLQKAYDELRSATETIAQQREREAALAQYRIASAQFRHEINNALGAVKLFVSNALRKSSKHGRKNMIEDRYRKLSQELSQLVERLPEADLSGGNDVIETLEDMRKSDEKLLNGLEEIVLKGIERGLKLSEKLRRYERIDHDESSDKISLKNLIEDVLKESSEKISTLNIRINAELDEDAIVIGSKDLYVIMISNLLENSLDAIATQKTPGEISIKLEKGDSGSIILEWLDTGIGIKKESRHKIFQPFYTEKPSKGSGLGLSMIKNIIDKYGGKIRLESIPREYTKFILEIPAD